MKDIKFEVLLIEHKEIHDEPLENLAVYKECKGNKLANRTRPNEWPNDVVVKVVLSLVAQLVRLLNNHHYLKRFEKEVHHYDVVRVHTKLRQANRF